MRQLKVAALLVLLLLHSGCGYFVAGQWTDDPKNFKRAWGYTKPDELDLVRSWYWRGAHFTLEEVYFFRFRWHKELYEQMLELNDMQPATAKEAEQAYCFERPDWFAAGEPDAYEVFRCENANCWMLRHRESSDLFIFSCQI